MSQIRYFKSHRPYLPHHPDDFYQDNLYILIDGHQYLTHFREKKLSVSKDFAIANNSFVEISESEAVLLM
jgi:hypothetical protein